MTTHNFKVDLVSKLGFKLNTDESVSVKIGESNVTIRDSVIDNHISLGTQEIFFTRIQKSLDTGIIDL